MPTIHLVAYTATARDGHEGPEIGVARVISDHPTPKATEIVAQIPGFIRGRRLGPAPLYTLRYTTAHGTQEKTLDATSVQRVGAILARAADRGDAWDIAVTDDLGFDVTCDFACFI